MKRYKEFKFVIDSSLDNLSIIGPLINKLCSLFSIPDTISYSIELCVVEAVANCIKHAYENRPNNKVEIVFCIYSDKLTIAVCDEGKKINYEQQQILRRDDIFSKIEYNTIDEVPETGRGFIIIKAIMDEVKYLSYGNKNCLLMTKQL